jgi:hypothetical protein
MTQSGHDVCLTRREKNRVHRRALAVVMYKPWCEITVRALETSRTFRLDPC